MSGTGPRRLRAGSNGVLLLLAVGVFACRGGVPAPGFATPLDSTTPAQIRAYLEQLKFDPREGSSDERALPVGCPANCREGPIVAVQPELRTHRNNAKSLAGSPGRIVARLINRDKKQPYPPLNLGPADTVYWAVDQLKPVTKGRSEGRSLFISAEALRGERGTVSLTRELYTDEHPELPPYGQALARWVPDTTTEYRGRVAPGGGMTMTQLLRALTTWNNCKSDSCCR
jgi:hypothetical protein